MKSPSLFLQQSRNDSHFFIRPPRIRVIVAT